MSKTLIWLGVLVGSTVGGFVATWWGAGIFSYTSLIMNAVGGLVGIWVAVKLSTYFGI